MKKVLFGLALCATMAFATGAGYEEPAVKPLVGAETFTGASELP